MSSGSFASDLRCSSSRRSAAIARAISGSDHCRISRTAVVRFPEAYWAAVARLEDLRLLARDRARTPRESLRLLERNPKEQGFLRAITGRFELIWYGYHPATAEDWSLAKEQLEKMGCPSLTAPTGQS